MLNFAAAAIHAFKQQIFGAPGPLIMACMHERDFRGQARVPSPAAQDQLQLEDTNTTSIAVISMPELLAPTEPCGMRLA